MQQKTDLGYQMDHTCKISHVKHFSLPTVEPEAVPPTSFKQSERCYSGTFIVFFQNKSHIT